MQPKTLVYLLIGIIALSCQEQNNNVKTKDGNFSKEEATELANTLNSPPDSGVAKLAEEYTITSKSSYVDSIWKLVSPELMNCEQAQVREFKLKKWSHCDHANGLELFQVEYVKDNIRFTEEYLLRNKQLIYAVEWEKRTADVPDDEATWWNCEYIIQDNHVVDHKSLGMGKTEGDSFNVQDIIKLWKSRKEVFEDLKLFNK